MVSWVGGGGATAGALGSWGSSDMAPRSPFSLDPENHLARDLLGTTGVHLC